MVDGEPLAGENLLESLENCKGSLSEANRLFLAGGHEQAGNERLQCSGKKCIVVLQGEVRR